MRNIIIDTDTASDDAVALILAVKSEEFSIKAITTVAGNVPVQQATHNALATLSLLNANIPVYEGASAPLEKELMTAEFAHGENGMGNYQLPKLKFSKQNKVASKAIIDIVNEHPNDIEIVAIGPLTNLALAIKDAPNIMKKVKHIYLMGGNGFYEGNTTAYAEFNYYVDPDAVKIVEQLNIPITALPWKTCLEDLYINKAEIDTILKVNNSISEYCINVNKSLIQYSIDNHNKEAMVLCDPGILSVMIDKNIGKYKKGCFKTITDGEKRGHQSLLQGKANYTIVTKIDTKKFLNLLINSIKK